MQSVKWINIVNEIVKLQSNASHLLSAYFLI